MQFQKGPLMAKFMDKYWEAEEVARRIGRRDSVARAVEASNTALSSVRACPIRVATLTGPRPESMIRIAEVEG